MNAQPAPPLPLVIAMVALGALLLALPAGCRDPGQGPPTPPPPTPPPRVGPAPPASFAVRSPAFRDGETLPRDFTCDGRSVSPPLTWEALPPRTRSLALIVEDPDAPGGTFVHWATWGIPASLRTLPEGAKPAGGVREGTSGSGVPGWVGPCPPPGPPHRYHFRLYALDLEPDLPPGAPVLHLHATMYRHILAESVLMGRYARAPR
jgi:hypothetical protein